MLVQSKEITMQPADALRVFSTDNYATAVQRGRLSQLRTGQFKSEKILTT